MLSDYLRLDPTVQAWFGGPWKQLDQIQAWSPLNHNWDRRQLVKVLEHNSKNYKVSEQTAANIQLLNQEDHFAVICGQQPAVGGGPLYSLIKCAHTVALCQQLNHAGTPSVPVFWCASEDHDEGEANHADLITRDGQVHRLSSPFNKPGASLRFQSAQQWWAPLIEQCKALFGDGLGQKFLESMEPLDVDESTSAWLCRILSQLFAEQGLICIEAHHLRPLWHMHIPQIIDHWPHHALANRRKEVMDAGYADSFNGLLNEPPLFNDDISGRTLINLKNAKTKHNWHENLGISENSISTGAALRPIVQQLAIPGRAFIGGPGELHYHAFLGPLYKEFNAAQPRFIPRCSLSVLPNWLQRYFDAWGLKPLDINVDSTAPHICGNSQDELKIDAILTTIKNNIQELESMTFSDDDLKRRIESGASQLHKSHSRLTTSIDRHRRSQKRLPPFGHLKDFLYPKGIRQERIMSMTQGIWLYGPGLAQALIEYCKSAQPGEHGFLKL